MFLPLVPRSDSTLFFKTRLRWFYLFFYFFSVELEIFCSRLTWMNNVWQLRRERMLWYFSFFSPWIGERSKTREHYGSRRFQQVSAVECIFSRAAFTLGCNPCKIIAELSLSLSLPFSLTLLPGMDWASFFSQNRFPFAYCLFPSFHSHRGHRGGSWFGIMQVQLIELSMKEQPSTLIDNRIRSLQQSRKIRVVFHCMQLCRVVSAVAAVNQVTTVVFLPSNELKNL